MADNGTTHCGRQHGDAKLGLGPPPGERIRGRTVRLFATISMLSAGLMMGACAMPDTESFRAPDASNLFRQLSVTSYREKVLPPVTPADLVDADGRCAGAFVGAAGGEQAGQPNASAQDAGIPLIPAAISLDMTECDVVKRAGGGARVEIGTNERRERTATLTYVSGERPGIYSFTDGRLKSMELGPEALQQPKVAKNAKKPAKPVKRAAPANQISVQ
jgi:hypothetical protein